MPRRLGACDAEDGAQPGSVEVGDGADDVRATSEQWLGPAAKVLVGERLQRVIAGGVVAGEGLRQALGAVVFVIDEGRPLGFGAVGLAADRGELPDL